MEVTNGYTMGDGRSRWGNEEIVAFNWLRNPSQSIDRVETIRWEAVARGLTTTAGQDVFLTTAVIRHGVEGMPGDRFGETEIGRN
ncbi:MAG: hypothetical protein OEU68_14385 [Nitrospira sp.]|nr:hypothetical protein [Nitrospira sp.]MDH4243334.1 hypothetical protein [Nitrospira sp.]MDH4356333.1 hypothetical protein [Nitrospira sp.]